MKNEDIPKKGLWYELYDFSERAYGNDWGYILYFNGKEVERGKGYSKISWAGDAARKAKNNYKRNHYE